MILEPPKKFAKFIRYTGSVYQPWQYTKEVYWLTGKALEKMEKELNDYGIHPVHAGVSIIELMKRLTKLEMNFD
jgi:hypothetical protein